MYTERSEEATMVRDTLVCLLAGGAGERLYPLTRDRAKPAVHFGGIYRIIDISLSNCVNSGLRHIFVITQYKALSLNRHLREGWYMLSHEMGEYVQVLPPMKRVGESWYQGTADAIYQNLYSIGSEPCKYVLILSGDHVYKMNYMRMLQQHLDAGAELTIGTLEYDLSEASRFGVLETDATGRIMGWEEKPANPKPSAWNPSKCNVSMGIYCFNRDLLIEAMLADADDPGSSHDFGRNVVPKLIESHRVFVYPFVDENKKQAQYWRDIGTIEAYYEANMDLVSVSPVFNLYDEEWPLRTYQRQYPPAKFVFAESGRRVGTAVDSIVASGSIVSGGRVSNSVLSFDVRVNSYSEVDGCIIFPHVDVGRHSRLRRAIIDRNIHLPEGTVIGYDLEEDRKKYHVSDTGIVVVVPEERLFEEPE
ncbi:MAG TPA: glucose-1-phosphate adenylyltransferase [Terriglobia bacterium]|nr:glucose-1-phosphate adenylyltransferase [Terriglobia bacterium]